MTEQTTDTRPRRSLPARIALIVTGAITGLAAAGLLAVGSVALLGDSEKDADGYLSTDSIASRRAAMPSPLRASTWISTEPNG